jgi:magnesium-transporting ATPase (P-type)
MLTGDKLETAENIAKSCNLIEQESHIILIKETDAAGSLIRAYK